MIFRRGPANEGNSVTTKRKRNVVDDDSDDEFQVDSSEDESSSSDSEDERSPKRRRLNDSDSESGSSDDGSGSSDDESLEDDMEEDEKLAAEEAAATLADTSGRSRLVIPNPLFISQMQYLAGPSYIQFKDNAGLPNGRGGRLSTATLGPGAVVNINSNAQSTASLPVLGAIRLKYPDRAFKAGHLLNAMFGGSADQKNITALTSNANGQQNTFDNRVKTAVEVVKKVYEGLNGLGIDVRALGYGIGVTVTVSDATWGLAAPEKWIATDMTCHAAVVGAPNVDLLFAQKYPTSQGRPDRWQTVLKDLKKLVADVAGLVAQANAAGTINNN
ncbi:hypothetical protein [Lentzea flaviverrucosa]|uniref:Uncharacterized protein n=1 Tax=Lentzea flaviverrucosa TaxID=200379 RepID=A0A1H9VFV4_9PSEU|nr:hypothetical protein [Lentzea flaviverrucosa]RDI23871.1 hypothetical protein DFR72_110277 [Lentzea flaviverrucosa]SES20575.1 hypothetical protein SAMN05216195_11059 [Lentzea flaviverrucosa]